MYEKLPLKMNQARAGWILDDNFNMPNKSSVSIIPDATFVFIPLSLSIITTVTTGIFPLGNNLLSV
ncbi:MAG: hypothetical protein ACFFCW_21240 [Candidatus Hodarchaeota archaeon]